MRTIPAPAPPGPTPGGPAGGKRRVAGTAALLLALAAAPSPAPAQTFHVRSYTAADGLPSSQVNDIAQDARGRVWVATRAGVACHNGTRWISYARSAGLPSPDQGRLLITEDDEIWSLASTGPVRLSRFDGKRWHPLPASSPTLPLARFRAAATAVVDGQRRFAVVFRGSVHEWTGDAWRTPDLPPEFDPWTVVWDRGRFLVGAGSGLLGLDPRTGELAPVALPDLPPGAVHGLRREGTALWIIGDRWIGRLDGGRLEVADGGRDLFARTVDWPLTVEPDRQGGIYFGHPETLFHYRPDVGMTTLGRGNGLVSDGPSGLLLDREGILWVAGLRGITKVISRRFTSFTAVHGLLHDEVSAILSSRDGEIVLGHPGGLTFLRPDAGGLLSADRVPRRLVLSADPIQGRVMDLDRDRQGNLWVALGWAGLAEITPGGRVIRLGHPGSPGGAVNSVRVDGSGDVWIGSTAGIHRVVDGRFEPVQLPDLALHGSPYVRRLVLGPDGSLYAAVHGIGVFHIRDGEVVRWANPAGTDDNSIFTVLPDRAGTVWVGTLTGLQRVEGGELRYTSSPEPVIPRPVYLALEAPDGDLWFGTDNGVIRWDGDATEHYKVDNGLVGSETNRAAGIADARGRLWFGTDRGVSVYDARFDPVRRALPLVELTSLDVGESSLVPSEPVELGDRTGMVVRFDVRSFLDEDRVRFQTWMEGLESTWREPFLSPERVVVFAGLPPGEYRFHVRALDVEGRLSEDAVSAVIRVLPPVWGRGWFMVLTAAMGALGIWLGVTYLMQRRYTERLRREVRARTRELAIAHEFAESERQRIAVTLGSIADGVLAVDPDGRIQLANPAASALLARPVESLDGEPLLGVLGPGAVSRCGSWKQIAASFRREGSSGRMDCVFPAVVRGDPRQFEAALSPIRRDGELSGAVIAFRDVTERERLQSELVRSQKLESVGVLAGGIAHDFNNLLTAILGNISLLESAPELVSGTKESARQAREASLRARSLTRQLLTFSKGGAPLKRPMRLEPVIRQSVDLALSGTRVRGEVELAPDLRAVEADDGQIGQVLSNLLINANQALPDGGTVRVRAFNVDAVPPTLSAGPYVAIVVEDDGVGIPQENLERIFDPYYTTKERGSGLGLAVAYSIARKHGGLLEVESTVGEGTTFRLHLPATEAEVERGAVPAEEPARGSGRILVMDDEVVVREVMVAMLRRLGYRADAASDGREAVERYEEALRQRAPYGAVILDLTVAGGMGGVEAVRKLLQIDPAAVVIVSSGYSRDPVLSHYEDYGFVAALQKPFEIDTLKRTLEGALSPLGARRRLRE